MAQLQKADIISTDLYCGYGIHLYTILGYTPDNILGASKITANLYRNCVYLYWEGCVFCSIYLRLYMERSSVHLMYFEPQCTLPTKIIMAILFCLQIIYQISLYTLYIKLVFNHAYAVNV